MWSLKAYRAFVISTEDILLVRDVIFMGVTLLEMYDEQPMDEKLRFQTPTFLDSTHWHHFHEVKF